MTSDKLRTLQELRASTDTPLVPERNVNKAQIQGWLKESMAKIADAERTANSRGTRMDAAYDAILFGALAVCLASGYRLSSKPGHHVVALEGAASTIGLSVTRYDDLDSVKDWRQRKYNAGFDATDRDIADAVAIATDFLTRVSNWFTTAKPQYLKP